jgi:predicted TIM-barrel fold metal-dependent hydrolase
MERLPNIPFILSHSGGVLPFLAHRISIFDTQTPFQEKYPKGALHYMKQFYFDTALSGDAAALDCLSSIANPSRILFGSDYPYISEAVAEAETAGFDSYNGFDKQTFTAINRGNAETLFPRFAG